MQIVRHASAAGFLARARDWLLLNEAENSLVLGLAGQLEQGDDERYQQPIYFATIEDHGEVMGCAWRTPPFKLGITRLPSAALPLLARDLADVYVTIPAILGREKIALELGRLWTQLRGGTATPGRKQRIHQAREIVMPRSPAPGSLGVAVEADFEMVREWAGGFARDTAMPEVEPGSTGRRHIRERSLYIWNDGGPRSMVAATGLTQNGVRISYVYTPPEYRGRGYASVAVGTLSRQLLEGGRTFCFLYTNLANPTSNSIYGKLGYVPIGDVIDVVITL